MSGTATRGGGELWSRFVSTPGGVMTEEAGAITGELELLTRLAADGSEVEALVRYAGAGEWYSVVGSPVLPLDPGRQGGGHGGYTRQWSSA